MITDGLKPVPFRRKSFSAGIGGRHRLNLFQNPAQLLAVSDDILKMKLAADLGFEIDIFLRKLGKWER